MNAKEKALFGKSTNPSNIEPLKLTMDSQLKFRCHPGVRCFTACCGNIKIVLTPYDILMLTRRLGIKPHEFLHTYTSPTYLEKTDMPGVMIKLREEDNKCPEAELIALREDDEHTPGVPADAPAPPPPSANTTLS